MMYTTGRESDMGQDELVATTLEVSRTIRDQLGWQSLATLGASNLAGFYEPGIHGGLKFNARILPFKKNGERASRPRVMRVKVSLTGADDYTVTVSYRDRGQATEHYRAEGIYADQLPRLMQALDWDGDEVLNPRLMGV